MGSQHRIASRVRGCCLALGLWLAPEPATASELSWSGPADCDQREQLVFQLERALAAPLSEVADFHFQVHVERTAPDARARLLVRTSAESGVSERVLVAPSCSKLVDTLTVAMALALEAAAAAEEPPSSATDPRLSAPATPAPEPARGSGEPAADEHGAPEATEGVPEPLAWRATLWLAGDAGSLPEPALGAALGLELGWPEVQLRALATLWLEQHAQLAGQPGLGGDLALATGALLGCTTVFGARQDSLALGLCAGGELGRLSGSGTGVLTPRSGYSLWAAARAEVEMAWHVPSTRLRLGAQLGMAVPFVRDDFVLDGIGAVHRPESLVARAGLGVGVAFE